MSVAEHCLSIERSYRHGEQSTQRGEDIVRWEGKMEF